MLRRSFVAVLLSTAVALSTGCNQSKSETGAETETSQQNLTSASTTDLDSVQSVPSEGNGLKSPAKTEKGERFDPAMDPSSVTSEYLKSLKQALTDSDSLKTANELLTSKARTATNLANVDVSLPGTLKSKYVVHQAKYVTNEKNVAHVLTSWNDVIDDQPYEYDVTWVLKTEPNVGWRVAGMITEGEDENAPLVFNFEDAKDIVSKGASDSVDPESVETQTAEKKAATDIR